MPKLTTEQRTATARFAHLAAVIDVLDAELALYEEAEDIHHTLPKHQRTRIENTTPGTFLADAAFALSRARPEERHERQQALASARQVLAAVIDDEELIPLIKYEKADLELIVAFIAALQMIGVRSKRDLARFFEAVEGGDIGNLIAMSVPVKGGARQKVEVRFAHELSTETKDSLRLPNLMGSRTRT